MKRYSPGLLLAFATTLIDMGTYRTRKLPVCLFAARRGADPLDVGVIVPLSFGAIGTAQKKPCRYDCTHLGASVMNRARLAVAAAITLGVLLGCATSVPRLTPEQVAALLSATDRSDADRANDTRRKAAQMLAFIDARPGMRVLDLGAGGGYTTELLARSVGANGRVYAQNNAYFVQNILKGRFEARMKAPAMHNVSHHVLEFENPVPAEVASGALNLVTFLFTYHDLGWIGTERARMNNAVFAALRSGGHYVLADHSGRPGTGISESKSLHRIEEALLRREVEAAGFKLVEEGRFLRNPNDPRDQSVFKPAQPNDEFVLKFVKP